MKTVFCALVLVMVLCVSVVFAQGGGGGGGGKKTTAAPTPAPTTTAPVTTQAPAPVAPVPGDYTLWNGVAPAPDTVGDIGNAVYGTRFFSNTTTGVVTHIGYFSPIGNTMPKTGSLWGPNCQLLGQVALRAPLDSNVEEYIFGALSTPVLLQPYQWYTTSFHGGDKLYGRESGLWGGSRSPPHLEVVVGAATDCGTGLCSNGKNGVMAFNGACPTSWSNIDSRNEIIYHVPN